MTTRSPGSTLPSRSPCASRRARSCRRADLCHSPSKESDSWSPWRSSVRSASRARLCSANAHRAPASLAHLLDHRLGGRAVGEPLEQLREEVVGVPAALRGEELAGLPRPEHVDRAAPDEEALSGDRLRL